MKTHAQAKKQTAVPATAIAITQTHHEAPPSDIAAQLDAVAQGHSFDAIKVTQSPAGSIQPKLTVGAPDDQYETEADQVAGQVMRMPDPTVQRVEAPEEEDELLQTKPAIQRVEAPEEEEDLVQTKPAIQRAEGSGSFEAGSAVESRIGARRGGGSPLPEATRAFMEPRFGADFSGVRVHTDGEADQLSQDLSARAFTTGGDIYFRRGEYSPTSGGGQELLAHELTHVVQQGGGMVSNVAGQRRRIQRVSPRVQRKIGFEFETAIPVSRYVEGEENPDTLDMQKKMALRGQLAADANNNDELLMTGGAGKASRVISHEPVMDTPDYTVTADNGHSRLHIALSNTEFVTKAMPITSLAAEKARVAAAQDAVRALLGHITPGRSRHRVGAYAFGYPSDALIDALYSNPDIVARIKAHYDRGMQRVNGNAMVQVNVGVELAQMEQLLLNPNVATGIPSLKSEPHLYLEKEHEPEPTEAHRQMALSVGADVQGAIESVMKDRDVAKSFGNGMPLQQAAPRLRGWLALLFNLLYRARFATPAGLLKDTTPILSKSGLGGLYTSIYSDLNLNFKKYEAVSLTILNTAMMLVANDNDKALVFARAAKYLGAEGEEVPAEFAALQKLKLLDALEEILQGKRDRITEGMLALKIDKEKRRSVTTSMKSMDTIPDVRQPQVAQQKVTRAVMELRHLGGHWKFDEDWQMKAEPYIQYAMRNEPVPVQAPVQTPALTKEDDD